MGMLRGDEKIMWNVKEPPTQAIKKYCQPYLYVPHRKASSPNPFKVVRPCLEYGVLACSPIPVADINQSERIQTLATRLVTYCSG